MAPGGTWERARGPAARDARTWGALRSAAHVQGVRICIDAAAARFLEHQKQSKNAALGRLCSTHVCLGGGGVFGARRASASTMSPSVSSDAPVDPLRPMKWRLCIAQHLRAFLRTAQSLHHCLLRMRMKAWQHKTRLRCTAKQSLLSTHGMPARTQRLNMPHSTASGCVLPSAGQAHDARHRGPEPRRGRSHQR